MTLADQYYIKALEFYPYYLDESLENLQYALSYNGNHVGALCLMGKFCMEQLDELEKAEEYIQAAILADPLCFKAYHLYSILAIKLNEAEKAKKLICFMHKLKGKDMSLVWQAEALLCEYQKEFIQALNAYQKALFETFNNELIEVFNSDIERVKSKLEIKNQYVTDRYDVFS